MRFNPQGGRYPFSLHREIVEMSAEPMPIQEENHPYVVLCLFVIRLAMEDASNDFESRYGNEKLRRRQQRFSEEAKEFLNGNGLEVWLKISGYDKFIQPDELRALIFDGSRPHAERRERNHDFSNI